MIFRQVGSDLLDFSVLSTLYNDAQNLKVGELLSHAGASALL